MHTRTFGTRLALIVMVSLPLTSCQYVDQLQAIRAFKDANIAYQRSDYPLAVELYNEVLADDPNDQEALMIAYLTALEAGTLAGVTSEDPAAVDAYVRELLRDADGELAARLLGSEGDAP